MALNNLAVKKAKTTGKQYKLADERGMYLMVTVKGAKSWRLDYRFNGKRKTLTLGLYPDLNLKSARDKRDQARAKIADGIDPPMQKQATRKAEAGRFEAVAREWFAKEKTIWEPSHADTVITRLENNIFPWLGNTPINDIEPPDMLAVLRRI